MFQELLASFTQSPQGQQAMQRLQQQGVPQQQASSILDTALPAAAQAMHGQMSGGGGGGQQPLGVLSIQNSSYVTNFLSAAVSGLVRGQGLKGAAIDGLQGVVGGHVAQVIASRFGLPTGAAGAIGAVITPLLVDFLSSKIQGGGLNLGSMFGGADANAAANAAAAAGQSQSPGGAIDPALGNQAQLPNGQSPAGGGALDQLKSGFGSLFQSESFTPSTFNPYG